MSLEKSRTEYSAKNIAQSIKNGTIKFDLLFQRSSVWNKKQKSALIESIIIGYPIPDIYAIKSKEGKGKRSKLMVLDGLQRLSTIAEFLGKADESDRFNSFKLTKLNPVTYRNNENNIDVEADISGLGYDDLPEEHKKHHK